MDHINWYRLIACIWFLSGLWLRFKGEPSVDCFIAGGVFWGLSEVRSIYELLLDFRDTSWLENKRKKK